jgi:adenosylmethionine-8-amino-7-oxononanoate aminotransferase
VELVEDKATRKPFDSRRRLGAEVCMKLRRRGVILRPLGDTVVIMPPVAMEVGDLRAIVTALGEEVVAIR